MGSNGYQVPDLASILSTLSNYGTDNAESRHTSVQNHQNGVHQPEKTSSGPQEQLYPRRSASKAVDQVDPTTIIEWPAALRHVTKLAAGDENIGSRIQKMIANQNENEQQWWAGREALIQKQASRVENRKKLDEVLRTVGGDVSSGAEVNDDAAELRNYDLKVHRAATTMVKSMTAELREMGIPFFGTQPSLLGAVDPQSTNGGEPAPSTNGKGERRHCISKEQHLRLQQRMIQHLEDMYRD